MSAELIRAVIASAHTAGLPATYELPSAAAATAWRHQFYRLRKRSSDPQLHNVQITRDPNNPAVLRIEALPIGVLRSAGAEVPITPAQLAETPIPFDPELGEDLAAAIGVDLGEAE